MLLYSVLISTLLLGRALTQTGLSRAEKQTILDSHNELRGMVSPTAANMRAMTWNSELARVAQNYAERCNFEHNGNRRSQQNTFASVGENLFAGSGEVDYSNAVQNWYNEVSDYSFSSNSCNANRDCGHYTQVVWATSTSVGCGAFRCSNLAGLSNGGANWLIFVCNYGPAGNVIGRLPYVSGQPCASCAAGDTFCVNNNLCFNASSIPQVTDNGITLQPAKLITLTIAIVVGLVKIM